MYKYKSTVVVTPKANWLRAWFCGHVLTIWPIAIWSSYLEILSDWIKMERRFFWLLYIFAAINRGNLSLRELESVVKGRLFPSILHVFIQKSLNHKYGVYDLRQINCEHTKQQQSPLLSKLILKWSGFSAAGYCM